MKPQISLSIPTPCHENWDAMTPETQGRFCSRCSKTVIDFTQMSDSQILKTIENATDNICGRVQTTQLKRTLQINESPKWQTPLFYKYAAATLFMFKLSMPDVNGQTESSKVKSLGESSIIANPHISKVKQIMPPEEVIYKVRVGGVTSSIHNNPKEKKIKDIIERYLKLIEKETNAIAYGATVSTQLKDVKIEVIDHGYFKVTYKSNVIPKIDIESYMYRNSNILLTEDMNIIAIYTEKDPRASGRVIISKYEINYFGKSNITIDLKEAITKIPIENAKVKITELNGNQKLISNRNYNNSQFNLENIKGEGVYIIAISAPNYYDSSFVIDKANYKKGNYTLPFFLKRNDEIRVVGYKSVIKGGLSYSTITKSHSKISKIFLNIKEAQTKQQINNVTILVTELDHKNIIRFEKKLDAPKILLENMDDLIKYNVKISASNYKEYNFILNKVDYKKGKFEIPVFLTKVEENTNSTNIIEMKLMPNIAVANNIIKIQIKTFSAEPMMLAIISQDGKYLQTQKVQTIKGDQTIAFTIKNNITPQMAFVKLMNAKGQWVVTEKLIIQ